MIKTRVRKMKTQAGGSSFEMVASPVNLILLTLNRLPNWAFSESLPEPAIQAQLYSPTVVQLGDMHTDTRPHTSARELCPDHRTPPNRLLFPGPLTPASLL